MSLLPEMGCLPGMSSLLGISAYKSDERTLFKEDKETKLWRIIAQREVHYAQNMSADTLFECSAIHESNASTIINNLQMRTIAHCKVHLQWRPSDFQRSTETAEPTNRRYEMKDMT